MPPVTPLTLHVTELLDALLTVATKVCEPPIGREAVGGATLTVTAAVTVTVAVPLAVGSMIEVALTVTVAGDGTLAGAV